MIQYILETLVFQLIFLMVYDLFLKKETFFQWNRVYLLATFVLSLVLPWVKIEALKTTVPSEIIFYPEFLVRWDAFQLTPQVQETSFWELLSTEQWLYMVGAVVMTLFFLVKLSKIDRLRKKGEIVYYSEFTKVIVKRSEMAFSFFKNVFLGDAIPKEKEPQILAHELVHIKQCHSLDLLFFELTRIVFWFNPLVYVFQNRMAELHEYIADSQVAKTNKKEQYQLLLSEAFQTQNLSFVNQFFKKSLIKKRIVMLTKQKSKSVFQLKYLMLFPLVLGMLVYTSCEKDLNLESEQVTSESTILDDKKLIEEVQSEIKTIKNSSAFFESLRNLYEKDEGDENIMTKREFFKKELLSRDMFTWVEGGNKLSKPALDILKKMPYPSSYSYQNYVNRKKVFQILDDNLKVTINQREKTIRPILKRDKNVGPSEWIVVQDVRDLSGAEVRKVNQTLNSIEGTDKMVAITDNGGRHSFLITNLIKEPVLISFEEKNEPQGSNNVQKSVPFALVDSVPVFPGCEGSADKKACFQEKIMGHIKKHFNYPREAQDLGVQGRVSVLFTIDESGGITDIKKRGPHELLENEVERIINRLPKMQPGKHAGKTVKVPFSIPITFKLEK